MQKAALPKGTRDFSPEMMRRRKLIMNTIEGVYKKYGFDAIETPAMENLSTLTGKYGDEGDQLLFKILNSGDYLRKADKNALDNLDSNKLIPTISEKGLRYDLTVPFARYVVQNQTHITFPFRRYQMQPVWRADRPQKGRYREFWQCDADVIGTKSLLCEADFIKIYDEVLSSLGLKNYILQINHRNILEAIAVTCGFHNEFSQFTVTLDKFDKIGWEGISNELQTKGFTADQLSKLKGFLNTYAFDTASLDELESKLVDCPEKEIGLTELKTVLSYLDDQNPRVVLNLTLARGLSYYTGCIFEATMASIELVGQTVNIGSLSGGGRYDDLTGVFGLKDVSGVGISFGLDRIYDVMDTLGLFAEYETEPKILFCHFDDAAMAYCVSAADTLRSNGITTVVFADRKKINKQFDYAHKAGFEWVAVVGDDEINDGVVQLKNMKTGVQEKVSLQELITRLT